MKWVTKFGPAQQGSKHVCSSACKPFVKNGVKYVVHFVESGVVHNPPCRTARCRRRK